MGRQALWVRKGSAGVDSSPGVRKEEGEVVHVEQVEEEVVEDLVEIVDSSVSSPRTAEVPERTMAFFPRNRV